MRWIARGAVAALAVGAIGVALAGAATATLGATKHVALAHHAAHTAPGKRPGLFSVTPDALPAKYTVVAKGPLALPANMQTHGFVLCPAKTVVYGGGVYSNSLSTAVNINSSYPTMTAWDADVNNASASATTFSVFAVCAKQNASWAIVGGTQVPAPAGVQTRATATCPAGDKILSGGGFSNSMNTLVNENSTFPTKTGKGLSAVYGWAVDQNNGNASDSDVRVWAVCGHAVGYKEVIGITVTSGAGMQTPGTVGCPAPKVPLGGGMLSNSASTLSNINTSFPSTSDQSWAVFEDNATPGTVTFTPYVICAGT